MAQQRGRFVSGHRFGDAELAPKKDGPFKGPFLERNNQQRSC
jgi:hypothetical protein